MQPKLAPAVASAILAYVSFLACALEVGQESRAQANLRFKVLKPIKTQFLQCSFYSTDEPNPTTPGPDPQRYIYFTIIFFSIKSGEGQGNVLSTEGTDKSRVSVGCRVNEIQSEL